MGMYRDGSASQYYLEKLALGYYAFWCIKILQKKGLTTNPSFDKLVSGRPSETARLKYM